MSKQLSHREILDVIRLAIEGDEALDTQAQVFALVSDLAELVANHLGYAVTGAAPPMEAPPSGARGPHTFEQCWSVGFIPTECTPSDGGLLAAYDQDITMKEWWEQGGLDPSGADEPVSGRGDSAHNADWNDAYNRIAARQGWGPDSERTVLMDFIAETGVGDDLPAFAARVAACENGATVSEA